MAGNTVTAAFPSGIAGVGVGEIERQVPAEEPPPLPVNGMLRVIGKAVPRQDARAKVTGAIRFTVDVKLPGMLHARILRSPLPHARIQAIDGVAAARHPGVRAVLTIAPRDAIVRYVGAPVAAVAASTPAAAEAALSLISVDYAPLPFVVDLDAARQPGAPAVYPDGAQPSLSLAEMPAAKNLPLAGNVRGPDRQGSRGDVEQGFAQADIVVEGEYQTQTQTHCCMEPHAIVADWRPDGLTVWMSTQYTAGVRRELAQAFGLKLSQVRVKVGAMGGGFGSKSQLGGYGGIAVMLSRQAQAPVRLVFDRQAEHLDTGNRPATWQHLRIGARHDGTLTAISLVEFGTAGVGVGASVGNFAQALYACPNFAVAQSDVFINAGRGSAMRGPGNTPGAFAMEQAIDELADKLRLNPLVLRDRIDPSEVRREERRLGAERIGWNRRRAAGVDTGIIKRGIGMAQSIWGANAHTNSSCEVRLLRDGSVQALSGVQDLGTGIGTILAQVVAEELGLQPADITVLIGDTDFPAGPPSYGSQTTASITPPARAAAWQVKQVLFRQVAPTLGVTPEHLVARDGRVVVREDATRAIGFRDAALGLRTDQISAVAARSDDYGGFRRHMGDAAGARNDLGGVQFAAVAVDTETGAIRVERVVAVQDCGRPMNPKLIESQVQGGVLMGLSYALLEQRVIDRQTGHVVNANLEQYKLVGPRETPPIDVIVLENYQGESATDAYGIAEPANISTAPAIANAVFNALGVRLYALPMTPAVVLAALRKLPQGS
ncbi:MAG TPA: xanthine dehydrogenase family protein molybdopterin-binding subunit [Acetobacteraceae bacterium]|nr:xanthine dehydrogenase family protein molybdopterin-binding subunit [Acetobacteraceae bacterium]